jgi:3-oxoadipate enol-lactonase
MPFADLKDIRIYFEISGTGPRLLSISGTGGDLRRPPSIFDMPIAQHFEILAYDQRGLGRTSKPDIPYTMADYAGDAVALLDAVGWDRCMLMGVSFGGMVAQEVAIRDPQRIERLVLACTSSGGAGGASYPLIELDGLPAEEYARRSLELSDTRMDTKWQRENASQFKSLLDQAIAGRQMGADEPGHAMGLRRQLEARAGHNTYGRLPGLKMPVYICGGRYDGIAKPANQEALHKQIPGSRLEFFEGGHNFRLQDSRAFGQIIAFLQGKLD